MSGPRVERALSLLALAYFAAVALGVLLDLGPEGIASSPAHLADGEAWLLFTSALAVEGRLPLAQVAVAALAAFAVIRAYGAVPWWGAVIAAHVGSALAAYAVIGVFDAFSVESAERVGRDLDYGVSVVLTGSLGALFGGAVMRGRRAVAVAAALGLAAILPLSLDWYGIEHPLGFAFGAGFMVWWERRGGD
jgi:hypothetical protein